MSLWEIVEYLFFIAAGYVSGSILFAYRLPKWIKGIDIRELSKDKNPGTANAFVYAGIPIGCMVILCELLKGALPVFVAGQTVDRTNPLFALVMASPAIGHAFSCFHRGKGGKTIAVSFGIAVGLYPDLRFLGALIFSFLFFSLVVVVKPHLIRAILTFMCVGINSCLMLHNRTLSAGILIIALTVIIKHVEGYHGEKAEIFLFRKKIK